MRLTLEDRSEKTETMVNLEADVKTLEEMVTTLEAAANEANSPVVRKLTKKYLI